MDNNTDDLHMLFVRYNQVTQVLPDRNYEPDIFDKFMDLTNVADNQSRCMHP